MFIYLYACYSHFAKDVVHGNTARGGGGRGGGGWGAKGGGGKEGTRRRRKRRRRRCVEEEGQSEFRGEKEDSVFEVLVGSD